MTTEHEASRTLVKSPPELWAECSEATSLARHLNQFGEIRITRLEPETAVAWEGEEVSGTVRLVPSGWGTRVIMTARHETIEAAEPAPLAQEEPVPVAQEEPVRVAQEEPAPPEQPPKEEPPEEPEQEPEPQPQPNPLPPAATTPARKPGLFSRLRQMFRAEPPPPGWVAPEPPPPEPVAPAPPPPEPVAQVELAPPQTEPEPPEPEPVTPQEPESRDNTEAALTAALDSLGQAHHRPFSRA